ncbi:Helix-turn-helix domain-containing protein [Prauserella marina]|uniref:Helix-turn-helix domain-containing protein n=1 Tax=Prauserella marina TaxID=530584 RepID=A0A1G6YYX9_9PSEU|nr:helix-turn-helix transcriptional regulator [Prauserella marina]SDD95482.1 Helix-turn-helix domain-containing protein [Prauserella marina]
MSGDGAVSPTLRRRRLGRQIRDRRTERKMSGTELAKRIGGINQARLSRVESGKATLTKVQIRKMTEVLELSSEQAELWYELWQEGDQLGWWSEYADVIQEHGEMLAGLESDAAHIRQYIEAFIPSMLTTEEYSHAVVYSSQNTKPSDMARSVEFRMKRQHRLNDPNFRYTVVIAEGALHRHVGGREVLARQLRYLLDTQWTATVEVLIVPFEADVYAAQGMSFEIMEFADPEDPECVFIEFAPTSGFLEKPSELRYYNNMWSVAASKALDVEQSRERIEKVWADLIL